ncbi:MAG: hypothetical protein J2P21_15085 [Chloracidobacterium sp.]|nr:hypothetical protein [Chloracidobacterium sp.]
MKWKSVILTLLLLLSTPRNHAEASPDYSLEELLKRAEIVYVGRVSELSLEKQPAMLSIGAGGSYISDKKIQLEIVEVLRGNKGDIKGNYGLLGFGGRTEIQLGALFLVLSQGDNYLGRPEPIISYLQLKAGQAGYCGWLMYPLSKSGGDGVVALLHSSKLDSKIPLTLNRVREAIKEEGYNPRRQ